MICYALVSCVLLVYRSVKYVTPPKLTNEYHVYFYITKSQINVPLFTIKVFVVIHDAIFEGQPAHGTIAKIWA